MKYANVLFILFIVITILVGCSDEEFTPIDHHQSFVASVNILEPSVVFYNSSGKEIASWVFDKAYTGAVLVQHDRILLYGHQLNEADIYELSTGKKISTIETGLGTTNAYYDQNKEMIFITNSDSNTLTSYDNQGKKLNEIKLGNYPLSMASFKGNLYVINYKDTVLSVVNMKTLSLVDEWAIPKSSSGIMILPEQNTIWIGGHGEGSRPNQNVDVLHLKTGKLLDKIKVSIMPVNFARNNKQVFITNHGSNELYATNLTGDILWKKEVGANPFAVAYFQKKVVMAGFDDDKLYFLENGQVTKSIKTDKGPFQLLVRENKK